MATLPSGSEITFLDLWQNINESAGTPGSSIDLEDLSKTLASGSIVSPLTIPKRDAIMAAPYSIDEVWGADYPSGILSNLTIKRGGTTETEFVDGETIQVGYDITDDWDPDFDPGDSIDNVIQIIDSSDNIDLSGTNTIHDSSPSGTKTKSFSNLALSAGVYDVKVLLSAAEYYNQIIDNNAFTHYDLLTGGSTSITNGSQFVDAADEAVNNVVLTPTVSTGVQTSTSIGTTVLTGGDGGNISATNTSGTTYSIQNTPGKLRFDVTHIGNPSQARNNTTSTATVDVRYNNAIDSLARDDSTINVSSVDGSNNLTISAVSEGHNGTLYIGYDNNNTASDKNFISSSEAVSTLYVRESVSKNFTISSAGTYYIKAYHNGDTNATVLGGNNGRVIVAPELSFSTTGTDDISVNGTSHIFKTNTVVGNNVNITISNTRNSTTTTDHSTGYSIEPGEADGIYTVTYHATSSYEQNTAPTDTLNVYPDAAFTVNGGDTTLYINAPGGSGLSDDSLSIIDGSVGDNISAHSYTITKDGSPLFSKSFPDANVEVHSTTLKDDYGTGTYNVDLQVTGGGGLQNTQTVNDAFTISNHPPQELRIVSPGSVHIARRGTETSITWTKQSATAVTIESYYYPAIGLPTIDTISSGNTGTSTGWTPDSNDVLGTTWKIYGSVDSGTATDFSDEFTLKDGLPTTPTSVSDSNGDGSAGVSWTDGSYNGGGNTVYIYSNSAGTTLVTTASPSGTSYTYSESNTSTLTRYFRVSGTNLSSEESTKSGVTNGATIYPVLNSSRNVINPDTSTLYSTTNNTDTVTYSTTMTFDSPLEANQTDNVNALKYWEDDSKIYISENAEPDSLDATQATVATSTGVGSATVYFSVSGSGVGGSTSQKSVTSTSLTINYSKEVKSTGLTEHATSGWAAQMTLNYIVQGFTATQIDGEIYDTDDLNNKLGSTAILQTGISQGAAQTISDTLSSNINPQTTFNVSNPSTADGEDGFKIKLIGKDSGGTIRATAFTDAFQLYPATDTALNCQSLGAQKFGYASLLDAADRNEEFGNIDNTQTVHHIGAIVDNATLYTSAALVTAFDGDALNDNTRHFFSNATHAFIVDDSGEVSSRTSRTPSTPTSIAVTSGSATDTTWDIEVTGNTTVCRTVRIYYGTSQGSTSNNTTQAALSQGSNVTTTKSNLDVSAFAGQTIYFSSRFENDDNNGSTLSPSTSYAVPETFTFGSWTGGEPSMATYGLGDTDDSNGNTYINLDSPSATVRVVLDEVDIGSNGSIQYALKIGSGGSWTSWGITPSVSVGAGSKDIYIKARLTQNKNVAVAVSGDDVIYLECISETYNQVDLDINWYIGTTDSP